MHSEKRIDEFEAEQSFGRARFNMQRFVEDFSIAVSLFELLERGGGSPSVGVFGGIFVQYRIVAAKDAAMNLYHFSQSLVGLRKHLAACHSLKLSVDGQKLRLAQKTLKEYFPHLENIRHAIAHAGDLHDTPAKTRKSILKEERSFHGGQVGPGGILMSALYERTYTVGFQGEVFSLDIDSKSVELLEAVRKMVEDAVGSIGARSST